MDALSSKNEGVKTFTTSEGQFVAGPDDLLGQGTYGTVYRVRSATDPTVERAVKVFTPETVDSNEGIPCTILREVNAIKSICHPNVMSIQEVVVPDSGNLNDMYIVMELCQGTLRDHVNELIKTHLKGSARWVEPKPRDSLPAEYVRECKLIAWQILNAVAVCHSRGIMHRDLKPANILWGKKDLIKIADFGLARFVRGKALSPEHFVPQTGEVQTMWYRAPEILLGDDRYGMLVDDWSVGCVIAEMFRFRVSVSNKRVEPDPIFPGRGDVHTLMLVLESLGTPTDEYTSELPFFSSHFPSWTSGNLRKKLQLLDDDGFNLISNLLVISPCKRSSSRYLLTHPWFNDVKPYLREYVPWYRGCEKNLLRLLEIDRLPKARPIPSKYEEKEREKENFNPGNVAA